MKYRKKPIEVEAVQWTGTNVEEITAFAAQFEGMGDKIATNGRAEVIVATANGDVKANIGDYIVRDVKGDPYPCKREVFETTHDAVTA